VTWLAVETWPALLPFAAGGIIAYALLPLVDMLDRVMPRFLAALVSVTAVFVGVVAFALVVVPPAAVALVRAGIDLPEPADVDAAISGATASLGAPPDVARPVAALAAAAATAVKDVLENTQGSLDTLVRAVVSGLIGAVGALIGLVVLPTWMLTVIRDVQRARVAIDRRIAPALRQDVWAVVAILDRATGSYLRGYVTVAILVGAFTWAGLRLSPRVGGPEFQEPLALALFTGASQLVPAIGGLLGLLPGLLILPVQPERGAAFAAAYVAALLLGSTLLGSRLKARRLNVHPAIMVPGIVAISQFGLGWLLLSAPIVAIATDLVRYAHGRLSEPPTPAGVLPGEPVRAPRGAAARSIVRRPLAAPRPLQPSAAPAASSPRTTG
jgi:predicted PurR-regulated permease PerM